MAILLQAQNLMKSLGGKLLFENASFTIEEGEHIGVIGPNGAGKTSLFRCLTQQYDVDAGEISYANGLRLAYLAQEEDLNISESIEDYIGHENVIPIWDLKQLGRGLGFNDEDYSRPLSSFSGGFRMRAKLIKLLANDPQLLLLDEPTNYLDLESLLVLERFLLDFKGSFLLISHDREFLKRVTDHTLEIEERVFTKFNGNLDDYFEQKAIINEQIEKQILDLQAKRSAILEFANKFRAKATKAKQVQSRLKSLDKMPEISPTAKRQLAAIPIPQPTPTGKRILQIENAEMGYPEKTVIKNVQLFIDRGDHLGIVGRNGAGKSTFLKSLSEKLELKAGQLNWGKDVSLGYYAQHVAEDLNLNQTVFQALCDQAHPSVSDQEIKDLAGALLFKGERIDHKLKILSGGEKARVALGQILLQKSSFILLDEPTNHLDFDTVEALAEALSKYDGALLVVSHDRSFIKRISHKIIEIQAGQLSYFPGSYDEYVWSLQKGEWAKLSPQSPISTDNNNVKTNLKSKQNYKELKKSLEKEIRTLEKDLVLLEKSNEDLEHKIHDINQKFVDRPELGASLSKDLNEYQSQLQSNEESWLEIVERLEQANSELEDLLK